MQKHTLSALFESSHAARSAVNELKAAGVAEADVSSVGNDGSTGAAQHDDGESAGGTGASLGAVVGGGAGLLAGLGMLAIPGIGPVVAAGWLATTLLGAAAGGVTGGLIGSLTSAGVPEDHAHMYAEGIRRGRTLVTAKVDESLVNRATDILAREGSVDIQEEAAGWRNEGWQGKFDDNASSPSRMAPTSSASMASATSGHMGSNPATMGAASGAARSGSVPIIEEELVVGKRQVSETVSVTPVVTEKSVDKSIQLRDESVQVNRTPVDRPANSDDYARRGQPLQTTVTHEEPISEKRGRVVAEVSLDKDHHVRTETVSDTVKRTDVQVDDQRRGQDAAKKVI